VVVLVLTVSIIGIYYFTALNIKSSINYQIQSIADSRAEQIKIYLSGLRGRIYDFSIDSQISYCLANITGIQSGSCTIDDVNKDLIENKLTAIKELNAISIFTKSDKISTILASSRDSLIGEEISGQLDFIIGSQQTYISEIVLIDRESNDTIIYIAAPIQYSGEDIGYLLAEVDTTELNSILINPKGLGDTGDVYLVDDKGVMLTASRFNENTALTQTINNENLRNCRYDLEHEKNDNGIVEKHAGHIVQYVNFNGDTVTGGHSFVEDQDWCLISETKRTEIKSTLNPILGYMTIVGIAIVLIFFLISNKISHMITNPLKNVTDEINHVADGYYKHTFRKSEYEEYDKLSKAIDRLVEVIYKFRKKEKERKQKEFDEE